jgi:uncharacterized protein YjgD (DUF1641 family)
MGDMQLNASNLADSEAGRRILNKLSDEQTLESLDRLLGQVDQLSETIAQIEDLRHAATSYSAIAMDTIDDACRRQSAKGDDIAERLELTAALVERITQPETLRMLGTMLDFAERLPGLLAMGVDIADEQFGKLVGEDGLKSCIITLQHFQNATKQTCSNEPVRIRGIFGWWRSTRDPHFQRGLGFFAQFLKFLGQSLEEEDSKKHTS